MRAGYPDSPARHVFDEITRRFHEQLEVLRIAPESILDCSAAAASLGRHLQLRYPRARLAVSVETALPRLDSMQLTSWRWWKRGVQRVCADCESLPLPTSSISLATSNLCLHRYPRPDSVVAEFARVLEPGGTLMATTFGPDTLKELRAAWTAVDDYPHVHGFPDMHDLGDALTRAGLCDVVVHTETMVCHYPDAATLVRDLKALGVANSARARRRSLLTPRDLGRLYETYEHQRRDLGLPATVELVYAYARRPSPRAVSVNFSP